MVLLLRFIFCAAAEKCPQWKFYSKKKMLCWDSRFKNVPTRFQIESKSPNYTSFFIKNRHIVSNLAITLTE